MKVVATKVEYRPLQDADGSLENKWPGFYYGIGRAVAFQLNAGLISAQPLEDELEYRLEALQNEINDEQHIQMFPPQSGSFRVYPPFGTHGA